MTKTEQAVIEILHNFTLAELLDDWELTINAHGSDRFAVRGWLMDEFERRDQEAFIKWLFDDNKNDKDLREYMTA